MLKAEGALGWGVDRTHQRQSEWDPPSSPLLTPREVQVSPGVLCPVLLLPGPETFCVVGMLRALGPPVRGGNLRLVLNVTVTNQPQTAPQKRRLTGAA